MTSRAERRRKDKARQKTQGSLQRQSDRGPLLDFIIYAGQQPEDVGPCLESLPAERRTIQAVLRNGSDTTDKAPIIWAEDAMDGRRRAAGRGQAPFLVFVDADCRLEDKSMLDIALGHLAQGAGAVGALLLNGGQVHAAGYAFAITGRPYRRFKGWSDEHPKVQAARVDLQAVPFGFLATRRDVFRRVGLRLEFQNNAFADADYCVRSRRLGVPVVYEPAIRVQTGGLLEPKETTGAVQLMLASAQPMYDEWAVL